MTHPVEKPLKGSTTPVSRLGGQVLREAGPWTHTVQRLLGYLRENGVDWCPVPQGWSTDGRETLSYLKGKVPSYPLPKWVYDDEVITTSARWMRSLHDLTTDFDDPERRWRSPRRKPAEVICHNDFAPYNMVFRDRNLVGVIDWDFASPGPRLWDLAYLAYRLVPLMSPDNPDSPALTINLEHRLRLLLDAYGSDASVPDLLQMVVLRLDDLAVETKGHAKAMKNAKLYADATNYAGDAHYLRTLLR